MLLFFISLLGMLMSGKSTVSLIIFLEISALYLILSGMVGGGMIFLILLNAVLSTLILLSLYSLSVKKFSTDSCSSFLL